MPQGLATSVVLAEICLAPLLRKYVDDLSLITSAAHALRKVINLCYVRDFALCLSREKTKLWGTSARALTCVASKFGFVYTHSLDALGMTWAPSTEATPTYAKELKRAKIASERLRRLRHLPAHLITKAAVINMGCLSSTAYSPLPAISNILSLRMQVTQECSSKCMVQQRYYFMSSRDRP